MTTTMVSLLPALPLPIDVSLPLDARAVGFTLGAGRSARRCCRGSRRPCRRRAPSSSAVEGRCAGRRRADASEERLRRQPVAFSIVWSLPLGCSRARCKRAARSIPASIRTASSRFLDLS